MIREEDDNSSTRSFTCCGGRTMAGYIATLIFIIAFLLIFTSYVAPQWVQVDPERAPSGTKFMKLGLWMSCYSNLHDYFDLYLSSGFEGCRWIYYPVVSSFADIREYLLPSFIVPVQIGFSLCFLGCFIAFFMIVGYLVKYRKGKDSLVPYLIILGMLINSAGILGVLCVIVFGSLSKSKQWAPEWQFNDLGWAFACAVIGSVLLLVSSVLFLMEAYCQFKKRKRRTRGITTYFTAAPSAPPSTYDVKDGVAVSGISSKQKRATAPQKTFKMPKMNTNVSDIFSSAKFPSMSKFSALLNRNSHTQENARLQQSQYQQAAMSSPTSDSRTDFQLGLPPTPSTTKADKSDTFSATSETTEGKSYLTSSGPQHYSSDILPATTVSSIINTALSRPVSSPMSQYDDSTIIANMYPNEPRRRDIDPRTGSQRGLQDINARYTPTRLSQRFSSANYNSSSENVKHDKIEKVILPEKSSANEEKKKLNTEAENIPPKTVRGIRVLPSPGRYGTTNTPNELTENTIPPPGPIKKGSLGKSSNIPIYKDHEYSVVAKKSKSTPDVSSDKKDPNVSSSYVKEQVKSYEKDLNSESFSAAEAVEEILASRQPMSMKIHMHKQKTETSYTKTKSASHSPPTREGNGSKNSNGGLFTESCL